MVKQGEAKKRLDTIYNNPILRQRLKNLARGPFPLVELETLLVPKTGIRYGTGTPPPIVEPSEISVPFIRATDIKNGEILTEDLLYIEKIQSKNMDKCLVKTGEMILVRSGVNTGDCAIVPEMLSGSYAAYDLILRFTDDVVPSFVSTFLDTETGRAQLNVLKGRSAQPHLNATEVSSIQIPKPEYKIQQLLVSEIQKAREARQKKLTQANVLLNSLDSYIFRQLDLSLPPANTVTFFAVRLQGVKNNRSDPHFHSPTFYSLTTAIQKTANTQLDRLVEFSKELWKPEKEKEQTFRYVEISGVNTQTGEISATEPLISEAPSRARMIVRNHDILISLTRPHRGAISLVGEKFDQCIASTGFAVIRTIINKDISLEYLWCILRSKICLQQMLQRSSGGNYPAITEKELGRILIPTPSPEVQSNIVMEAKHRYEEIRRLREEAQADWESAKAQFERKLLERMLKF